MAKKKTLDKMCCHRVANILVKNMSFYSRQTRNRSEMCSMSDGEQQNEEAGSGI